MFGGRYADDFAKGIILLALGCFGLGVVSVLLIPILWNWIKPLFTLGLHRLCSHRLMENHRFDMAEPQDRYLLGVPVF